MQYYAICNKETDSLNIVRRNGKETSRPLVMCIKIKFIIVYSLIDLIKKFAEL